jgi:hypothetical protein
MKTKSSLTTFGQGVIGLLVMGGLYYLGTDSLTPAPDYAIAYINHDNNTYLTPPCLNKPETRKLEQSTIAGAYKKELNLGPDPDCREADGFFQQNRTGFGTLMEKIGILSPIKSRWNPDGTWNY